MAQLHQEYDLFLAEEAEGIVVGPENSKVFKKYFGENNLPFVGIPDPKHTVLKRYGQEINFSNLGACRHKL